VGLPSETDANPTQFGSQRRGGAASAPTATTPLSLDEQFGAAHRRKTRAEMRAYAVGTAASASCGGVYSSPWSRATGS
jgi:hypothetical protein